MIRKTIGVGVGLLICVVSFAQNPRIDSLNVVLKNTKNNTARADLLHELASASFDYNFEQSYNYAEQSLELAKSDDYIKGQVQALTDIGLYHYFIGDYKNAFIYYRQALQSCGNNNFGNYPAYTLTRLGNLFRVQAEFDSARFYYDESIRSLKNQKGDKALSSVYYNLGILSIDLSSFDQALSYLHQSLAIRSHMGDSLTIGECLKSIGQAYRGLSKFDSAIYYYEKTFTLAKRYNDPELQMFYYINRGEIFFIQGDYRHATQYFLQALESLKTHNFKRYHAIVLGLIAQVYDAQGDYKRALEHLLNSLRIHESLNSRQEIARSYGAIGWLYINQKNDSMAISYANRSLEMMETIKDKAGIAFAHNLLGYVYYTNSNFKDALDHFNIALRMRTEIKSIQGYTATTFNIARVFEKEGLYEKAQEYLLKVLEIDRKNMDMDGLVMTYNTLGNVFTKRNRYREAERYLTEAHDLAISLNTSVELRDNHKNFAELYKAKADYKNAILFYDQYIALNDSIFTQQSTAKIAEMNTMYELEKKEQEIQILSQKDELNQSKIQLQQTQIKTRNYLLFVSIGGVILLIITSYVLYQYYKTKSIANDKLKLLNREISEQKEEIQSQSEELVEANSSLVLLNNDLIEKTEEVQAQSEELRETNEMITEINRDLDSIVTKRTSQLQEAYKELDTFFYRSSHDFRRPLTTFMGLAEVAKITIKDQSALELFSKVKETAVSLDKMLVKLQSISDVSAQQLVYKEVLIKEIFDTVCDSFREELQRYGINTKCRVTLGSPFVSYPAMVKIIVENLVENAIHFRAMENPFINLKAYRENDQVIIEIEDNGQGIREEYTDKIFEMYFRANERSKGNGLGLYIVKKAVQKLNGTIQLTTNFGAGSSFTIKLPVEISAMSKF